MARAYPQEVGPIRDVLRIHRGELKKIELSVGADGRNRVLLSAFGARTGRNQPSNTRFIFGPAAFLRSLIRPGPGRGIAYCDWSAQELAIAAALSGDQVMQDAYRSGDPYLFLARKAGAVPDDATKQTHPAEREAFKVVSLGVLYGLSAEGLARRLDVPVCRGRELLRMHQEVFRRFWQWSDRIEMEAMLTGRLRTTFGWSVRVPGGFHPQTMRPNANPRSLRNFPMQGNGAEMLRLACCLATERGITVCAPIHDALLVEGPAGEMDSIVQATKEAMREASLTVLNGFPIRVDAKVVRYPHRFADERGREMWEAACSILEELEQEEKASEIGD
jgi:DNA polymerase I-like protein with 3'-5' exonuclease and polymerase domains